MYKLWKLECYRVQNVTSQKDNTKIDLCYEQTIDQFHNVFKLMDVSSANA